MLCKRGMREVMLCSLRRSGSVCSLVGVLAQGVLVLRRGVGAERALRDDRMRVRMGPARNGFVAYACWLLGELCPWSRLLRWLYASCLVYWFGVEVCVALCGERS